MTSRLDHIAIIVAKLENAVAFYRDALDLGEPVLKSIPELNIRCAFFDAGDQAPIELVEFSGEGEMVHGDVVIAIEVEDLDLALTRLRAKGVRVFDQRPTDNLPIRRGWVMKGDAHGTVIELCPRGEVLRFVRSATAKSARS